MLHDLGVTTLLFDLREHGLSDGTQRGMSMGFRETQDVESAVTYLRSKGVSRVVVLGMSLGAGAAILSAFVGSRPADPDAPAEKRFLDVIEEMAIAAGLPVPRAMVVETPALNAFASGYDPAHAMITATSGILAACTREELEGVIGHEPAGPPADLLGPEPPLIEPVALAPFPGAIGVVDCHPDD